MTKSTFHEIDCSGIDKIQWDDIVGDKTLLDGGHFGDLMEIGREHIQDAKYKGELTEQDAGQVYSALITTSIHEAINFELVAALRDMEMCKIKNEIENEKCLAAAECALKDAQTNEIPLESLRRDCTTDAECDLKQAQEDEIPLESARRDCTTEAECDLKQAQEDEIPLESGRRDCTTDAECDLKQAQEDEIPIESGRRDCTTEADCGLTYANTTEVPIESGRKTSLNNVKVYDQQMETQGTRTKQMYTLSKEYGYNYSVDDEGYVSIGSSTGNGKIDADTSAIKTNASAKTADSLANKNLSLAREKKLACDCCSSSKIAEAQASLYARQAEGFSDHITVKLYEIQMNAWAMVYQDMTTPIFTPSIQNSEICNTYRAVQDQLTIDPTESNCNPISGENPDNGSGEVDDGCPAYESRDASGVCVCTWGYFTAESRCFHSLEEYRANTP